MGSVPIPRTFQGGETETASYLNTVTAALNFVLNPPRCSLYQATGTAITSDAAWHPILFDSEEYDTDGMHSTTTNTSRITPQTPGRYRCTGQLYLPTNATGVRQMGLWKNNAGFVHDVDAAPASGNWIRNASRDLYFNGTTDYIELQGNQNSGATLTNQAGINYTWLQVLWVAAS